MQLRRYGDNARRVAAYIDTVLRRWGIYFLILGLKGAATTGEASESKQTIWNATHLLTL